MADITYDVDDIRNVKLAIDDLVDTLDESCNSLNTKLETLRNAWNTKAGTKFFNEHKSENNYRHYNYGNYKFSVRIENRLNYAVYRKGNKCRNNGTNSREHIFYINISM